MPNVLAISRYFPPLSSAGASIRLIKFIKYAAEQGWSFTVFTQDVDRPVIPEKKLSEFLLSEIPGDTNIVRIGNPFFGPSIFVQLVRKIIGHSSLPWGISVFWNALKSIQKSKPAIIFVNSPPFTNAAVGYGLATLFNVPLILDMKDDWINPFEYIKKGFLHQFIKRCIEKIIVGKAFAVITVSQLSFETYKLRYASSGWANKIFFIPNGEDFDEYSFLLDRKRSQENKKFRLLSASSGYRPDYRDLTPFLHVLQLLFERFPEARQQIEIEFAGEYPDKSYLPWLQSLLPTSSIHYSGVLDRHNLIEHLWNADLFFLIQPRENYTAIAGTLYEYCATGKAPVLLFSETGASSNLVISNNLGEHFNFHQVQEASFYMERVFKAFCSLRPIWIDKTGIEMYDRKKLANQMMTIWSDAINSTRENK